MRALSTVASQTYRVVLGSSGSPSAPAQCPAGYVREMTLAECAAAAAAAAEDAPGLDTTPTADGNGASNRPPFCYHDSELWFNA